MSRLLLFRGLLLSGRDFALGRHVSFPLILLLLLLNRWKRLSGDAHSPCERFNALFRTDLVPCEVVGSALCESVGWFLDEGYVLVDE